MLGNFLVCKKKKSTSRRNNSVYMTAEIALASSHRTPVTRPYTTRSHTLSNAHRFMVFFRNRNSLEVDSHNDTHPTLTLPLSDTHIIHTPTLPPPTFLTFTCTQVLWFLTRLDPSVLTFSLSLYRHPSEYMFSL